MWMDYSLVTLQAVVPDAPVGVVGTGGTGYPMGLEQEVPSLVISSQWHTSGWKQAKEPEVERTMGGSREVWGRQSKGENTAVGNRLSSAPLCQFSSGLFSFKNIG